MKKILIFASLALALAAGLFAAAGDGPSFHRRHMGSPEAMAHHEEFMAKALDLNDEQKAAARKLHEEAMAKAKPLMEQQHQSWKQIHSLLDGDNPDPTTIGQRMIEAHATGEQLKAVHEETMTKFKALLNADQLEKIEKLKEMHGDRGDCGGFGFRHHGH